MLLINENLLYSFIQTYAQATATQRAVKLLIYNLITLVRKVFPHYFSFCQQQKQLTVHTDGYVHVLRQNFSPN